MNDVIALVPVKYAGYVVAVIGVASVLAPLLPPPGEKGFRGSASYKALYVVMHWVAQNGDKVQAAVKHEGAAK
jgi:hypothetical protein